MSSASKLISCGLVTAVLCGCSTKQTLTSDDTEVLQQTIDASAPAKNAKKIMLMSSSLTAAEVTGDQSFNPNMFAAESKSVGEAWEDFMGRNGDRGALGTLKLRQEISFADPENTIKSDKNSLDTYREFRQSGGMFLLSFPGYNKAKDIALVYVGRTLGPQINFSRFLTFKKKDGKWEPLKSLAGSGAF